MDLYLAKLFNNGDNDGDITIISEDNIVIKCHSYVTNTVTDLLLINKSCTFNIKFPSKIIILVLNRLYNSNYKITRDSFKEASISLYNPILTDGIAIIKILELLQYLGAKYVSDFVEYLCKTFESILNNDNWMFFLSATKKNPVLSGLHQLAVSKARFFVFKMDVTKIPADIMPLVAKYFKTLELVTDVAEAPGYKYIINKYSQKYIKVSANNSDEVCDSIAYFMMRYGKWCFDSQYEISKEKPSNYYNSEDDMLKFYILDYKYQQCQNK